MMTEEEDGQHQEVVKGKRKNDTWTMEERNEMLYLLVDACKCGWRNTSGTIPKLTVETKILPQLNAKLQHMNTNAIFKPKTYENYLSRWKWFKRRYTDMCTLMRFNSGFGWSRKDQMLKVLNTITPDMMAKPPLTLPFKIKESTRFYPHFKECIGAMDGTHILATVRGRDKSSYRDRHGKISQNVLAACNFDLEFMYVLAGWEGSTHDSKVLADALSRTNGLTIPDGKYFLVDCGFANRRQFLAPYRGVRYHLPADH